MKNLFIAVALLFCASASFAQVYKDPNASVEARVEDVLSRLTNEEKIDFIGGKDQLNIRAIARLGIPQIRMSDASVGIKNYGNGTAYPASILGSATWDVDLSGKYGMAIGSDARSRGVHMLLGPGVNIYRAPMCGRNFEYLGEDPFLSGQMVVAYIKGLQSKGVVATVKHFAANNSEWNRQNVSSDMDERTLQEIYLPAFKAAVQQGKAGAVMCSYNLINGVHASQNSHLNNDILKTNWKFDGILMSDWGSTYSGIGAALGGLDLEMPDGKFMNRSNLLPAIKNGTLPQEVLDDKVRRILRMIFRFGFYDTKQEIATIPKNDPQSVKVALDIARSGIVLLQNKDSILPLSQAKIKTLAVIGPNADQYVFGGGSSIAYPFSSVTTLQGIKKLVGTNVTVNYSSGIPNVSTSAAKSIFYEGTGSTVKGLKAEYFKNKTLTGVAFYTRTDALIDYHWPAEPNVTGMPADNFSIRWTGVVRPLKTGRYIFTVSGDDGYRLWVNDKLVIDHWVDGAISTVENEVLLTAGQEASVKLEYFESAGLAEITFSWRDPAFDYEEAAQMAAKADAAIVCVGFNSNSEQEGYDRTFELPAGQDSIITAVAKANPNTIVIVNAGGNVSMVSWIDKVKGLIHAFYPGQEGGTALAEILFGITNPSGKLPVSFEKKWADNPTFNNYYENNGTRRVKYNEGIFVGYRYYDTQKVEPMFPFGFGLSYTSFTYSNLAISGDEKTANRTVSFDVTNTGTRDGSEAAQVYVHQVACDVPRPLKELKGFAKVALKQGETKTISLVLDSAAFSYYKTSLNGFGMDMGEFEILVGSSSRDIRLKGTVVQSKYDTSLPTDTAYFPTKNAQNVALNTVFNLSFNKTIFYTAGKNIFLKNAADNSVVETIAESNILGMGTNVLTFKTKNKLTLGIQYFIEIDSAAIVDFSNNVFAGIKGTDKWTFKAVTTGIENNHSEQDIQVYPVPAKDVLNFKFGSFANHKVDFFDLDGRVVNSFATNNMLYTYSCSGMKKGMYICRILNDKETILKKIRIE